MRVDSAALNMKKNPFSNPNVRKLKFTEFPMKLDQSNRSLVYPQNP